MHKNSHKAKALILAKQDYGHLILDVLKAEISEIHEFVITDDLSHAIQLSSKSIPDIVVVDWMSEPQFLREFRKISRDVPVIITSHPENTSKDDRAGAFCLGANDFLSRPLNWGEFITKAKQLLLLHLDKKDYKHKAERYSYTIKIANNEVYSRELECILCLSKAAEYRDPETGLHIMRMAHYSKLIASQLGLPEYDQEMILTAAPMHDVGKVGVPDAILLKPGKLTPDEMDIMKSHAVIGYEILSKGHSETLRIAAEIALSHHEKFDGTGYPRGLKGKDIPLFGRIVAVADVFDALTSKRPYKKSWSIPDAVNFIETHSGKHFDPECVQAFLAQWDSILEIKSRYQEDADDTIDEEEIEGGRF